MTKKKEPVHRDKNNISAEVHQSLHNRYKTILIEKLTEEDLEELQMYLKNQFDKERHINQEYKNKFELKLRTYFHEETLKREITSIEALIQRLKPEDLKK